jgi:hypothetical protein
MIDVETAELHAAAGLCCTDCSAPRGYLSNKTFAFIEESISLFGAPITPVVIRRGGSR